MLESVIEESSEILTELVDRASELGYLTTQDILQLFPQAEDSASLLEELFNFLHDAGIEIQLDEPDEVVDAAEHDDHKERRYKFGYAMFDLSRISVDDSVGLYLKEMASVPLLKIEEEVDLAKRYERGRKAAARLIAGGRLSNKRRGSLQAEVEDGRLARAHIIKANTRLVVSIAKKYVSQGVPFLDLIQEGNLGLMKAVEKFDYRRGFRFSTYATWWIRQTITRAVADQSRTIRVPVHMNDRIRNLYKTAYMLEQRHGRQPTAEELAEELDLEPEKVRWMFKVSWQPMSLEQPAGEDGETELGAFIEDDRLPPPGETAHDNLLQKKVEEVLATLSPREACILRMRFGLPNGKAHTLEQVGRKFGLTRERIRQIEGKALRRLRHPRRARMLREYST
ncbi:MAG: sigma-70 family RNA polymerase sigma factor [Anaerolineales bacterium]|jgi:RNA polymerase primary sigma factor|nr:sigma-70 family RNA polymerase sigma factor [Anaerolineales bacterium]